MNNFTIRILWILLASNIYLNSPLWGQVSSTKSEGEILFHTAVARIHELDTAILYFQKAMPFLEQEKSWSNYVNCLNALHYCYFEKDDYQRAESYAQEALEAATAHLKRSAPPYSYALNNLGTIYVTKSDYLKAIHTYEQALEIMKMNGVDSDKQKAALADAYSNIGTLLLKTGQYETAFSYLQQCEKLKLETLPLGKGDPLLAKTYRIIADALDGMGRVEEAVSYLNKITHLLRNPKDQNQKRQLLRHYHFLVEFFLKNDLVEQAQSYLERISQLDGDKMYRQSKFHYLQARLAIERRQYEIAARALKFALEKGEQLLVDEKSLFLRMLGNVWHEQGDLEQALFYCQKSLDILEQAHVENIPQFPLAELLAFQVKGEILQSLNSWKDLIKNTQAANERIIYLRKNYRALGEKLQLAELSKDIYEQGISAAFELFHQDQDRKWLEHAFEFSERSKANILFEGLMHSAATFHLPDSLKERENQLRIEIDFEEKLLFQTDKNDSVGILGIKNRLFDLNNDYKRLVELLEIKYPVYYDEKYNYSVVGISSIQANLASEDQCLAFFWGNKYVYLFKIEKEIVSFNRIEAKDSIEAHILQIRAQISKPPSEASAMEKYLNSAWELTEQLMLNEKGEMPSHIQRFMIIPDGLLAYLPFEVLLSQKPNLSRRIRFQELPYLVKKYVFSYQYSTTMWLKLKSSSNVLQPKKLWAGYAPTYSNEQVVSLQKRLANNEEIAMRDDMFFLPFAKKEVEQIGDLLKGTVFLSEHASESQFKNQSTAFSILHLATHGFLEETNPLYSQLLFSQISDSLNEDGKLQAYELYNMNLNADLVVLSACNTGMGKLQKGEGVMSLSRAFSAAGCQSLLLSLWQVSDESTSKLMIHFYKNLLSGARKDEAIQTAQKVYIESCEESLYAHPYFWAGFVMTGNMKPIDLPRSMKQIGWWAILGLSGILIGFWGRYMISKRNQLRQD